MLTFVRRRDGALPDAWLSNRRRSPNRAYHIGQPPGWLWTALTARKETNSIPAHAADVFSRGVCSKDHTSAINTHRP
jgi:hypothetical protein